MRSPKRSRKSRRIFGDDAIDGFLIALKSWFVQREYGAAIELIGYFQEHGRLPEIAQPSQTGGRRISRRSSKDDNVTSLRAADDPIAKTPGYRLNNRAFFEQLRLSTQC